MNSTFKGKHVVISGGGSGVGAAIVAQFADNGALVTLLGRDEDKLKAQAQKIGADTHYAICDVADREQVNAALASARAVHGPVAIAIANAGIAESRPFAKMDSAFLERTLAINVSGVFNLWQECLDDMKAAGWGRLIAIASIAGLKGYGYVSAYCASKHAVIGLTRALAQELAKTGITVNSVCPGYIDTPMLQRSIDNIMQKTGMEREAAEQSLLALNPQGRFISAEEVAASTLWLASETSSSVNGHALSITGGEV